MTKFEIKANKDYEVELPKEPITNSQDAHDIIKEFYKDDIEIYESFFILLLNQGNVPVGYAKISQGGVSGTVVDIKIIMKYVIDCLAQGVICAHNHPSGNLEPSNADLEVTKRVKKACEIMHTSLLDHIILTPSGKYTSFSESGII